MRACGVILFLAVVALAGPGTSGGPGGLGALRANLVTIGASSSGDQDITLRFAESDANHDIVWDDGDGRFEVADLFYVANLVVNGYIDADSLNADHLVVNTTATLPTRASITIGAYTQNIVLRAGMATLGPTAPTLVSVETFHGLSFDADAETCGFNVEIPDDWHGTSDLTFAIYWTPEAGDSLDNGQTVEWNLDYRSIDWGSQALNTGNTVRLSPTHTQSGAGHPYDTYVTTQTLAYNSADQPLTAGDVIGFDFKRDKTNDTYDGDAIMIMCELRYTSVGLRNH
jgi:hypothetical protein